MRLRQRQRETKKEDRSKLWEEDEEVGEQPPNKRRTLFLTETDQWKIPSPRHRTIPSFFFFLFLIKYEIHPPLYVIYIF